MGSNGTFECKIVSENGHRTSTHTDGSSSDGILPFLAHATDAADKSVSVVIASVTFVAMPSLMVVSSVLTLSSNSVALPCSDGIYECQLVRGVNTRE
jgi:hypothetical protein